MPKLILMFKDRPLNAYPFEDNCGLTIGRRTTNDIIIDNLAVSGFHARIDCSGGTLRLEDLKSKNGTMVNGAPVSEMQLNNRDTITIGKHTLLVDLNDEMDVEIAETPAQISSDVSDDQTMHFDTPKESAISEDETIAEGLMAIPENDMLHQLDSDQGNINLSVSKQITIGRNKDADIVISGFWGLMAGSPAALIKKQSGSYVLRYAGGLIKPKRNGSNVKGTAQLNHEDIIELGPVKLQLLLGGNPSH